MFGRKSLEVLTVQTTEARTVKQEPLLRIPETSYHIEAATFMYTLPLWSFVKSFSSDSLNTTDASTPRPVLVDLSVRLSLSSWILPVPKPLIQKSWPLISVLTHPCYTWLFYCLRYCAPWASSFLSVNGCCPNLSKFQIYTALTSSCNPLNNPVTVLCSVGGACYGENNMRVPVLKMPFFTTSTFKIWCEPLDINPSALFWQ